MTALVLSGSIGSTTEMWEPQLPALAGFDARSRSTIRDTARRLSPPGRSRSPTSAAPSSPRSTTAASSARQLCGLSLGGAVCMWLAANAPERVDRLVLACTRAWFDGPEGWAERAAAVRAGGVEAIADAVLERWFTPAFRDRARWRAMMTSIDPEGYARCCEVLGDTDLREDVRRIEAPTLVLTGADDEAIEPEETELLVSRIPDARHVEVPGAHLPNIEHPAPFSDALVSFLG